MRDDDDGAVFLDGVDAVLDLLGGDGIEAGGGLVKEDDGRVFEEHARNGHTLLLTAREIGGVVVELFRQFHHLVVEMRLLGGLHHVFMGGVGIAVKDILLYGAVEDVVLLQHEADVLAEVLRVVFAQIHTIQQYLAYLRLIKLVQ